MTDAEKKMKKYTCSVERRLNLPREVKVRVMSDFTSSIQARREAGQSDEAIYNELGTPKAAAAELNEQMKEYAYRKSPWRFLFAAASAYGLAELLSGLLGWFVYLSMGDPLLSTGEAASLGIIGGADGPTAIFVTAAVPSLRDFILPVLLIGLGIWGFFRLRRCTK